MSYESENKNVSHPAHYQGADGMETIDVIRNFTGPHYVGYLHGNAIKYVLRYEKKNGIEDLEKAIWYLTALKEYLEKAKKVDQITVHGSQESQDELLKKLGISTTSSIPNTEYINAINRIMEPIQEDIIKKAKSVSLNEGYLNKV